MQTQDTRRIRQRIDELAETVKTAPHAVILVSNEVGAGIVPENRLARRYRDLAGWTHQAIAAACDRVVWTVAGIPVTIKPAFQNTAP
jgi:adenosylcobinamide kinase/adenosylcobinamide-phosphate guanylyltransferase